MLCLTDYTTAIDIWAAGCILAELVIQDAPFRGRSEGDQLFAIFRTMGSMTDRELKHYEQKVPFDKSILQKLGCFEPRDVKGMFVGHGVPEPEAESMLDLMKQMLRYIPEERLTAEEALQHAFLQQ